MVDDIEKIPLDARLLSYAIIELNISRRNVSIYPKEHPSVTRSLGRTYDFLRKLFEIRSEITLAVAKDTIIIDEYKLDKKNPVFREFALNLSKMHIAYITLHNGVTKDELYQFHSFLSEKVEDSTVDRIRKVLREYNLQHINIRFVDYGAFSFAGGEKSQQTKESSLWERYIFGLLEGSMQGEAVSDKVRDIPPKILAQLLNRVSEENHKEEAYDRVITAYMRSSSDSFFSGTELKKMLTLINHLRPELKKQFLSSTVKNFSSNIDSSSQILKKLSVEEIIGLLNAINEQKITIPEPLMNLLDKFTDISKGNIESLKLADGLIVDDIILSPEIDTVFKQDNFVTLLDDTYQQEIQKLLNVHSKGFKTSQLIEFESEFNDDLVEKKFNQIMLELMVSPTVARKEYQEIVSLVQGQSEQLLWIGEYGQILMLLNLLESNKAQDRFADINSEALYHFHADEFLVLLVDSLRILGKQKRKEVTALCEYYDHRIIPFLIDALIEEDSQMTRRFLMDLLKQLGDKVIPEATKRLADDRWFVKRNMLYILSETNNKDVAEYIQPYCRDENLKVSFEALRCLLSSDDSYAIDTIKEYLRSDIRVRVEQAIALSGSFRIKEVVGDLIQMLKKTEMTGSDFYDKIPVVKALGDIGDPQAVETLRRVLAKRSILFRGVSDRLKEEIYKTLNGYPYESVRDLVEAGLKSKNQYIRTESLRLSKANAQ